MLHVGNCKCNSWVWQLFFLCFILNWLIMSFLLRRWHHIFIAHKVILIEREHLVVGLLKESSPRDAGRNWELKCRSKMEKFEDVGMSRWYHFLLYSEVTKFFSSQGRRGSHYWIHIIQQCCSCAVVLQCAQNIATIQQELTGLKVEKDRLEVPIKKYSKNLEDITKVHSTFVML